VNIIIPEFSLILLIGPSGAGKSTFAHKHFKPTEILSSDFFRGMISDDENNQTVSKDVFEILHLVAAKRLSVGKLTVVDATNLLLESRSALIAIACQYHCSPIALVLNLPEALCLQRDQKRSNRNVGSSIVQLHSQQLQNSLPSLEQERFHSIHILNSAEEINDVEITRQPLHKNFVQGSPSSFLPPSRPIPRLPSKGSCPAGTEG
jgi:protein phosphatase